MSDSHLPMGARYGPLPLRRLGMAGLAALCVITASFIARPVVAAPFIWDQDNDRIDDRATTVHLLGYEFSFEGGDTLSRQRIDVSRISGGLLFGVYVVFDHTPSSSDLTALTTLGMPVLFRYEAVNAVRCLATYVQIQAAAALPGVERVESVPVLYPLVREGAAAIGVRDATQQVFPNWATDGGGNGDGQVIAILDTGVNDAADGAYPGHESLIGRCLGGALFTQSDSTLDTPRDGSVNPEDHGGAATSSHGTHVAGIALGTGGTSGYAMGVAPGARFVDVKVLNDAGVGTGVAEAIDWCIHNRARDWGDPDPARRGIDIINLSLSSTDETDGTDVASKLAARAVQLGIVVVASMGNDGEAAHVPSPAGAPGVIAVGAVDDQRTPLAADDLYPSFDNRGPRASDGDPDASDEQKPDLLAPGVAVLSADGDLTSDGAQYHRLTGTSMAAAFVSGAVALLRSENPSLTPAQIAELLHATAWRGLAAPAGPAGVDPRWNPSIGWGVIDLYAARLEARQPDHSQVARLELSKTATTVGAVVRTQRERGAANFVIERAPDLAGVPGSFAPYDSAAAAGDSSLADPANRAAYAFTWTVLAGERGTPFWYRVAYSEAGARVVTAARRFESPLGPSIATVEVTLVHNAYDSDVDAMIQAGAGSSALGPGRPESGLTWSLPGSSDAVSSDWVPGVSTTGNVSWTFRIEIPDGPASAYLPPDSSHPWWISVAEGGYLNRSGRLSDFRLIWHSPGGDVTYTGGPTPQQTIEGGTIHAAVPQGIAAVDGTPKPQAGLSFGPNPVRSGEAVSFAIAGTAARELAVYDLTGRRVARVPFAASAGGIRATWSTRDAAGQPLPAGIYFARAGRGLMARVVLVR